MKVQDVVLVDIWEIKEWGRSYIVVLTEFCKKLGLKVGDGFKVAVRKDGIIVMQPIKNVKEYLKKHELNKESPMEEI